MPVGGETTPQLSLNLSSNPETSAVNEKEKQIRKDQRRKDLEVMHQSIPAVPPPRATAGHFLTLSVPGVGHSQFYRGPGAGHLHTPGRPLGI